MMDGMIQWAGLHVKELLATGALATGLLAQMIPADGALLEKLGVATVCVVIMGAWVRQVIADRNARDVAAALLVTAAEERAKAAQARLDAAHADNKETMNRLFGQVEGNTKANDDNTTTMRGLTDSIKDLAREMRDSKVLPK